MTHTFFLLFHEYLHLCWIHLKVKFANIIEYGRVVVHYYPHLPFAKIDLSLLLSYLLSNPFHISKKFLVDRGEEEVYTYGETPLTTMELIARKCEITSQDTVFELGCGRGRTCFWLNQFIGCSVVGIDYIPPFIEKGQNIRNRFNLEHLSFRFEDLFQSDFQGATVIYLYGTCFPAAYIDLLIEKFSKLPKGTKIITVSYSLKDFQSEAPFQIVKQFPALFTWGETEITLQIKK